MYFQLYSNLQMMNVWMESGESKLFVLIQSITPTCDNGPAQAAKLEQRLQVRSALSCIPLRNAKKNKTGAAR